MYLKDDNFKEINNTFTTSDDVAPLFKPPKCADSLWSYIKESLMTASSKNPCMVHIQEKAFSSNKTLISIVESSKDDGTKIQITSVTQMLYSANLNICKLHRVFDAPFFKLEYTNSFLSFLSHTNSPSSSRIWINRQKKSSKNNHVSINFS